MRLLTTMVGAVLLLASLAARAKSEWVDVTGYAPLPPNAEMVISADTPNPTWRFDAIAYRGSWIRFSGHVDRGEAQITFALSALRNGKLVVRYVLSTCDAVSGPTTCRAFGWVSPDTTSMLAAIFTNSSQGHVTQVRLETASNKAATKKNRARLELVIGSLQEKYYRSAEVDWVAVADRVTPMLETPDGVDPIPDVVAMIRQQLPGHEHTAVIATERDAPISGSRVPVLPTCLSFGDVGVLQLPGTFELSAEEKRRYVMDGLACLKTHRAAKRWVVDLRENGGGDLYTMLASMAPLLHPGHLMSFVAPNGDYLPMRLAGTSLTVGNTLIARLAQTTGQLADRPVIGWIGRECASSCEALAIILSDRQRTRLVGQAHTDCRRATRFCRSMRIGN